MGISYRDIPSGRQRAVHVRRLHSAALALLMMLSGVSPNLGAQERKPGEYDVKAAYLYSFGLFVDWPQTGPAAESFTVCVLGRDPFGQALDTALTRERIGGKSLLLMRISKPQEALNCRIVFISASEEGHLKAVLMSLQSAVLTVSDMPDFSRRGGMIGFVIERGRVRFEVNLAAAENAGLTVKSELLRVAKTVRTSSQPGA
jgi:hypothetical protein